MLGRWGWKLNDEALQWLVVQTALEEPFNKQRHDPTWSSYCLKVFSDVFSRSNDISKNGYKLGAGKLVIFTSEIYHYYLMLL